jgi:hypothetical protein
MSRELSEENIEMIEDFISYNPPSLYLPNPSISDQENAINDWKQINEPDVPVTSYLQFGSDGYGMTSYGFYKSRSEKIYLVVAFMNNISSYHNVTSEWYFIKRAWQ